MAKDMERHEQTRVTGSVQPYQGGNPGDLLPHTPRGERYDRPDWTALRPPADTRWQEGWAKIVQPYRATLLARLWLTFTWWRPVVGLLIIGTITFLLWIVITG